jgi:transposase
VSKALKLRLPPGYQLTEPRCKPVLEPVRHILDAWIEQNKTARRKQRQHAMKMYERLCDEHDFEGSYGTVQRYVKAVANRQKEVFMPLQFEPGQEAQVDWHEGWVTENGMERKLQFFVMRLCYSKAPFVYPYEKANLESFLDGHVRAFEYFGGVPQRIAYDNLKCAVIKVGKGQHRRLTKRFRELRAWYLFETRFCNVARGNEKAMLRISASAVNKHTCLPSRPLTGLISWPVSCLMIVRMIWAVEALRFMVAKPSGSF